MSQEYRGFESHPEEEDKPQIHIVGLTQCPPCDDLKTQLEREEIKKLLMEKYGTDKTDILYADQDGEEGNKARNFCYSLEKFSAPFVVVEKKHQNRASVCLLDEDLEEERCGIYRQLPL